MELMSEASRQRGSLQQVSVPGATINRFSAAFPKVGMVVYSAKSGGLVPPSLLQMDLVEGLRTQMENAIESTIRAATLDNSTNAAAAQVARRAQRSSPINCLLGGPGRV